MVQGDFEIPWRMVAIASSSLISGIFLHLYFPPHHALIDNSIFLMDHCRNSFVNSVYKKPSLLELVLNTYYCHTTDPRDKIYALLGLTRDVDPENEEDRPDYGLKVADVFKNFVIRSIKRGHNLKIFSLVDYPTTADSNLPSWIPHLSKTDIAEPFAKYDDDVVSFQAAGETTPRIRFSDDGQVLHATGKAIDQIRILEVKPDEQVSPTSTRGEVLEIEGGEYRLAKKALKGFSRILTCFDMITDNEIMDLQCEAILRTLVGNKGQKMT